MEKSKAKALGVAPLSAIDLPHAEYVRAAHAAGFGAIGLRLEAVSVTDVPFPRDRGSKDFRGIVSALAETGLEVLDVEVLSIRPDTTREEWLPLLELGAELGASYLNVVGDHPDLTAFADIVAALTVDAEIFQIQPVLEPVGFRPLNNFDTAVQIARAAGCGVELDVLHYMRTEADFSTIADNPDLFPILQLCDAPTELSGHGERLIPVARSRKMVDLMIAEARDLRLLPGHGNAPIGELLAALQRTARISVEIPNTELRAGRPAPEYLRMLASETTAYLGSITGSERAKDLPTINRKEQNRVE
ncbi:sugar phosphate isomerase/epimerase family protein [Arthrobacter sulfonylureivorans]|uniref:sugar phosphate isomerase/epimerase family protein n=1 Tax=Arthrobacter sulfonylureivorans TaxID=2486855 RepID=UPI0039E6E34D